jgi:hypothetical protein
VNFLCFILFAGIGNRRGQAKAASCFIDSSHPVREFNGLEVNTSDSCKKSYQVTPGSRETPRGSDCFGFPFLLSLEASMTNGG